MSRTVPIIQQAPFLFLSDHPDQHYEHINDAMKAGYEKLNKLDIDPGTVIKDTLFSQRNINLIQRWLTLDVLAKTGIQIPPQKMEHIMHVIEGMYSTYGQNLPFNLKEQIYELDMKVVQHLSPLVITELYARARYYRDINAANYIDNPQFMSAKGQRALPQGQF
jgi:hypothetical protein